MSTSEILINESANTNIDKIGKGYRNLNDVENFYRFVYENKVRREAHMIIEAIVSATKALDKKSKRKKSKKALKQ